MYAKFVCDNGVLFIAATARYLGFVTTQNVHHKTRLIIKTYIFLRHF